MRLKFNVIAGLVTVVLAVAAFFLMGNLLGPQTEEPLTLAAPEVIPATEVEIIKPDTAYAPVPEPIPDPAPEMPGPEMTCRLTAVLDIYIEDNRVWVATPDGLIQTDRNGTFYRLIDSAEGLDPRMITEIVRLPGRTLFAAGREFYEYLGPDVFRRVELPLVPPITYCHAFDSLSYLAGYEDGVFQYTPDFPVLLKDDILVTSLAFGPDGLWVGTDGDGLWRYDGEKWQQRFLRSDTGAFDYVTALSYHWPHLMVGTPDGVYRFDGGKWETHVGRDSTFPGGYVTDLAFANHRWYIGTSDHGLWILLGSTFIPVDELAETAVTRIKVFRKDVYIGTQNSGVYVRRAGHWRQLYQTDDVPEIPPQLLTLL